jgi:hypothetical protein
MSDIPTMNGQPMWDSEWLHSVDLAGKEAVVVIKKLEKGELFNPRKKKPEKCWVLEFEGKKKRLVANKTNLRRISKIHGDAKGWAGKKITIMPDKCGLGGEIVDCIRVKETTDA